MNCRRFFTALFSFGVLWATAAMARAAEAPKGPEVLVVADAAMAPEGFRPTPGKPIHYILHVAERTLGEPTGGLKLPGNVMVEQALVAELSKQGFVRTEIGGPIPAIFILAFWGDTGFDPEMHETGKISLMFWDQSKLNNVIGMNKLASSLVDARKIADATEEDRYYLTVAAFDAATFKQEKRLLWRTSMSVEWRNDFIGALPVMLASAGSLFGTNVDTPRFMDDAARRNAEVHIGEVTVVPNPPKEADPATKKPAGKEPDSARKK